MDLKSFLLSKNFDKMEKMRQIYQCLLPVDNIKYIHIAGTNGKGSTTLKIGKYLQSCGFKVGFYTSPHLFSIRERIMINDTFITMSELDSLCKTITREHPYLTLFQLLTFCALVHFNNQKVDYAVIEVGAGGLRDCTNVITPILSVITSISKDHCKSLGNTLGDITMQKCGIIKPGIPVVSGCNVNYSLIHQVAKELNSQYHHIKRQRYPDYNIENGLIAQLALGVLGFKSEITQLLDKPYCRFDEIHYENNTFFFDVGHNQDGLTRACKKLGLKPKKKIVIVLGMCKDKLEPNECINVIKRNISFDSLYIVNTNYKRMRPANDFYKQLKYNQKNVNVISNGGIKETFEHVKKNYSDAYILVVGSFYIMADSLRQVGFKEYVEQDNLDDVYKAINF